MTSLSPYLKIQFVQLSWARKIFEFLLVRWASNPQVLLARGTFLLARVFKLINNS